MFLMSAVAIPLHQLAARAHLAGALHRHVDLPIRVLERAFRRIRQSYPEEMVRVVIRNEQLHVARVLVFAHCFELLDLGEGLLVHLRLVRSGLNPAERFEPAFRP
jgi:hypothetical protein